MITKSTNTCLCKTIKNLTNIQRFSNLSEEKSQFLARQEFNFRATPHFKSLFPQHMKKGLSKMRTRMRQVDCVIEVHDARIPFSGRNPLLSEAFSMIPSILLLNKVDLVKITENEIKEIYRHYKRQHVDDVMFTVCQPNSLHPSLEKVIPLCINLVNNSHRYNREMEVDTNIMIVGIPNVGKSSIIKALRKHYIGRRTGVGVGADPGFTKSVSNKIQVMDEPVVYILDTPGIFQPHIKDLQVGFNLALCNTISSHHIGSTFVADYLLFKLNKTRQFQYVDFYGLEKPTDNITVLINLIAKKYNIFHKNTNSEKERRPNVEEVIFKFLNAYRQGDLGKFFLDRI